MKKAIISMLLMLSFIFIAACDDANESSENSVTSAGSSIEESQTSSETESSISESNIAGSSGEAESSEESDESIIEIVESDFSDEFSEEQDTSSIEVPKVDMPVGVTKVGNVYYLNYKEGNEFIWPERSETTCYMYGAEISFENVKQMMSFIKNRDFYGSEKETIKYLFPENEYGIALGNLDYILVPAGVGNDYKQEFCSWMGRGGYHYSWGEEDGYISYGIVELEDDDLYEMKVTKSYTYEGLKENDNILNVTQTVEIKEGITYYTLDYNTKRANCKSRYFNFNIDNTEYYVYIDYESVESGVNPLNISKLEHMYINIKSGNIYYTISLGGNYINESIDYITSFGVEKISLKD